jgi:hypothetical protein
MEFLADQPARVDAEASSAPADRPSRSWHHLPDDVAQLSDPETLPEPIEGVPVINAIPIVNEYASPVAEHRSTSVDHVDAPVETAAPMDLATQASLNAEQEREAPSAQEGPAAQVAPAPESEPEATSALEAKWIAEERNSFDWQSVASLAAARQNEERRAEDDWAATSWDRKAQSESEQVAALLNQVIRRVRTGELKVEATRGMSAESALAATLAALLRSED